MSIEETIEAAVRRAVAETVPQVVDRVLRERRREPKQVKPASSRLTPQEVASRVRRDVSTVRRWARQGRLSAIHINGRLLFREEDVKAFEDRGGGCEPVELEPNVVAMRILRGE